VFYLAAGVGAGVVVSLFTRHGPSLDLDNFYALVRTPVMAGEKWKAPCQLPEGIEPPQDRKLLPGTNIEIQVPSPVSIIGFIVSWVLVGAIIYSFYVIASG